MSLPAQLNFAIKKYHKSKQFYCHTDATLILLNHGATEMTIEEALNKLEKSKFRASFRLTKKEREYLRKKGLDVMRRHAEDFVRQKLTPAEPVNDGKQTPMHGHPVFKAMHGTACCCRGCLNKWYKVPLHKELSPAEQEKIVNLLMAWIERNAEIGERTDK